MTHESSVQHSSSKVLIIFVWLIVLIPMAWGIWETLVKVSQLF